MIVVGWGCWGQWLSGRRLGCSYGSAKDRYYIPAGIWPVALANSWCIVSGGDSGGCDSGGGGFSLGEVHGDS